MGYQAPSDKSTSRSSAAAAWQDRCRELVAGGQNIVALADVDFAFVDREVASRTRVRHDRPAGMDPHVAERIA